MGELETVWLSKEHNLCRCQSIFGFGLPCFNHSVVYEINLLGLTISLIIAFRVT
ncbi:hypothetical protein I79_018269 [Cricetulus griseus]|uniref:Uncharacterized protein n=1 Tax=Cricetulus griseus TaxID=10029 RepID=G3I492_CRIGR|nr:hypothetical protein I79_018269 [Cricetulus griseus]